MIFTNDHEPAHVHVYGDGEAKINLGNTGGVPELVWMVGMRHSEVRRAMALVLEHRGMLLARRGEIHG